MAETSISGRTDVTEIFLCVEKRRLLEEFTEAVHEMMTLQQQQVTATLSGDSDFSRFDLLLHLAAEKKQQAKYAYIQHVEQHGC
jgi:hypothetical protein